MDTPVTDSNATPSASDQLGYLGERLADFIAVFARDEGITEACGAAKLQRATCNVLMRRLDLMPAMFAGDGSDSIAYQKTHQLTLELLISALMAWSEIFVHEREFSGKPKATVEEISRELGLVAGRAISTVMRSYNAIPRPLPDQAPTSETPDVCH